MKLIWHSNSPRAGTGYGQQTAMFLPRLAEHYNVACSAFYGAEGHISSFNGVPILPGIGLTHGNETIHEHARTWFKDGLREGLVVTLMDVWVLDPGVWRQLNTASWCPVDHDPAPAPVVNFFRESGSVPIAMSRFGQEKLKEQELDPLYVPHAVDTSVYKPLRDVRKTVGFSEDAFIVGMVAANKGKPSRKCFEECFEAFKAFNAKHPESVLYLHTEATGRFDGVDLPYLLRELRVPQESVIWCDQYRVCHYPFSDETMAKLFNSLDVLLMPSAGEGFGIPAIQAQACGVPVIGSNFTAQPETIGCGWLVEGHKVYTPMRTWQQRPDVEEIVDALDRAYAMLGTKAGKAEARKKGREHAKQYDVETVLTEHMLPALEEAQERFGARKPLELAA